MAKRPNRRCGNPLRGALALAALLLAAPGARILGEVPEGESEREDAPAPPRPETEVRDLLMVTGGAEEAEAIAGSSHYLGTAELARQTYSDIHRVLGQVEGVVVQEEDGFGLRPNIGMRGTGVIRSEKVTLLEDGVLIAPAPYSAPAAYYFPATERMEAVEVRKGSSAISQGPYTTGGVINLVTSRIPARRSAMLRVGLGSWHLGKVHGRVGDSRERIGWLLEGYHFQSDGFKELDGGGSTGVELDDFLGKLRWAGSGGRWHQSIEVKLGAARQRGEETYLGLTADDFEVTPYRRYAASQADRFHSRHAQAQLQYLGSSPGGVFISAVGYRHRFSRDWYKLQSVAGISLARVLDAPALFSPELAILRGEVATDGAPLALRHNRRDYLSQGLDFRASRAVGTRHEVELGIRVHHDEEDRFQEEDEWDLMGGRMVLSEPGTPGSQANRYAGADALALYLEDTIRRGRLTVTPGVRIELIDFERWDFGRSDPMRSGTDLERSDTTAEVVLPGVSAAYSLGREWTAFVGLHRGFAAPGPGQDPRTDAEKSTNSEAGFNFRSSASGARLVAFYNDYANLIGRDTLAAGGEGTGATFNGGEATVYGLELSVDTDLGRRFGLSGNLPLRFGYTWTRGEFDTTFETRFADWAPAVQAGDQLPYVPPHRVTLAAGWMAARWQAHLNTSWTDITRTRPGKGPVPSTERVDDVVLVDLATEVAVSDHLDVTFQARNLLDETYLAARRPAGLRPGLPRTFAVVLRWHL